MAFSKVRYCRFSVVKSVYGDESPQYLSVKRGKLDSLSPHSVMLTRTHAQE
jgi:hypothetical protein